MDMNFKKGQLVRVIGHNSSIDFDLPYNFSLINRIGIYFGEADLTIVGIQRYNILCLGQIYKFYSTSFESLEK